MVLSVGVDLDGRRPRQLLKRNSTTSQNNLCVAPTTWADSAPRLVLPKPVLSNPSAHFFGISRYLAGNGNPSERGGVILVNATAPLDVLGANKSVDKGYECLVFVAGIRK